MKSNTWRAEQINLYFPSASSIVILVFGFLVLLSKLYFETLSKYTECVTFHYNLLLTLRLYPLDLIRSGKRWIEAKVDLQTLEGILVSPLIANLLNEEIIISYPMKSTIH